MIPIIVVVLSVSALLFAIRVVIGPTLADRVVGLNGMLLVGMALLAVQVSETKRGSFLSVLVLLAVTGFVGTAMIARFLQRRGR